MKKASAQVITVSTQRALVEFAQRLDQQRKLAKLTIEDLCTRVGTSRGTYNRLLKGDPGIAFGTVAEFLNMLGILEQLDDIAAPVRDHKFDARLQELLPARVTKKPKEDF